MYVLLCVCVGGWGVFLDSCYVYHFGCFHLLLVRMLWWKASRIRRFFFFFVNLAVEKEKLTSGIVKAETRSVWVTAEQIRNRAICHVWLLRVPSFWVTVQYNNVSIFPVCLSASTWFVGCSHALRSRVFPESWGWFMRRDARFPSRTFVNQPHVVTI